MTSDAAAAGEDFGRLLFGRTPDEDLALYGPDMRALLATLARAHLERPRPPGTSEISLDDIQVHRDGGQRELTVIQAVNGDAPYLLDSTLAELVGRGIEPRVVAHPILAVRRDGEGRLLSVDGEAGRVSGEGTSRESLIHIHVDRIAPGPDRDDLVAGLEAVYADVRAVAADIRRMSEQLAGLAGEYRANPPPVGPDELTEATAFLDWLAPDHFDLLGIRAYRMPEGDTAAEQLEGSGLGLLRDPAVEVLKRGRELVAVTPEIRAFLAKPELIIVTKASVKSRVRRHAYLDYVAAKLFSPSGKLWGELVVVGLFTGSAYTSPATSTPYLRRKISRVLARAGFDPESFDGRALTAALETYPRDELFQLDDDDLFGFALDILRLTEHPRIRALVRADPFHRFVSVIVYIPKDRYSTDLQRSVGEFLARTFGGRVSAVYPAYPDGPLARTHVIIGRDGDPTPPVSRETIEAGISAIARSWTDRIGDALLERLGGPRARVLLARFGEAFGPDYRNAFDAGQTLADIEQIQHLSDARPRAVDIYRREGDPGPRVNLKMFSKGEALPLSERVPLLEALGFRVLNERTYRIAPVGQEPGHAVGETRVWLHDMALERATGVALDIAEAGPRLEAALLAILRGLAEVDGFNKLVLEAGLGWREAALIRALARYLRQILIPYAQDYLADVLVRHGEIVAAIVALFYDRFDPTRADGRDARAEERRAALSARLAAVTSLDDDRILRRFLNLVEASVRTNFFQLDRGGLPVETLALKFDSRTVDELPRPRPLFEIFMNSPRVEALHLRFGKVARGGLRWTDRPQDFRTEVLGLVKAQQVKNAVIVPVGAKGGFFPKRLPPATDRAAWMAEGTEAYRIFIRTLLDLTDNLDGETIVPPPEVVRHDGDDPYLVVAADKGTATFSDTANAISIEKGHWLGDAFASGGSQGYDHKQMGITARGAWEAVERHFREIDIDIGTEPVTVVGVGDMSGDVFGNGMLLSRTMKLVAAFDHRDIFVDPNPDPELAWIERERLFGLPRSSWADYDRGLISAGGGVFSRGLKMVELSPEAREALGVAEGHLAPADLMRAILKAPVGLLWFGGIGTYVRAASESDAGAGDRANDAVRITGAEIRAKVVGEGANLGMTQRGRIEAARAGVRLNTDAIDNSAGVNTSDVEVNIKIALATPERDGRLDGTARNALLAEMTDEVAALVLRNNYLQTLALSLSERRAVGELGFMSRLMDVLETSGRLDRGLEFLPDRVATEERRKEGRGLTRPELSVLLAYAKLALHDELLASPVPDDPYLGRELDRYFPAPLRERFPDAIASHRLRREIISTQLANAIVNRGGPAVITRLTDETGADAPMVAAAYAATRDSFRLPELNGAIDALDGTMPGQAQLELYAAVQDLTLSRMAWFIRNVDLPGRSLDDVVGLYGPGIAEVASTIEAGLVDEARTALADRAASLARSGVPDDLARRLALLPYLAAAPDMVLVAQRTGRAVPEVATAHLVLDEMFGLPALAEAAAAIPVVDYYDRLARDRAVDAISVAHRRMTAEAVQNEGDAAAWAEARQGEVGRIRAAVESIAASGLTVSKLTVAASLLADLAKD